MLFGLLMVRMRARIRQSGVANTRICPTPRLVTSHESKDFVNIIIQLPPMVERDFGTILITIPRLSLSRMRWAMIRFGVGTSLARVRVRGRRLCDMPVVCTLMAISFAIASGSGYWRVLGGLEFGIARGIAFAPFCDLLWMETKNPVLSEVCLTAACPNATIFSVAFTNALYSTLSYRPKNSRSAFVRIIHSHCLPTICRLLSIGMRPA